MLKIAKLQKKLKAKLLLKKIINIRIQNNSLIHSEYSHNVGIGYYRT